MRGRGGAGPLEGVWLRGLSELRYRRRSWLGLALLIGLAGGFVVCLMAGVSRTSSAYDRLLAATNVVDVAVRPICDDEQAIGC